MKWPRSLLYALIFGFGICYGVIVTVQIQIARSMEAQRSYYEQAMREAVNAKEAEMRRAFEVKKN